MIKKEGKRTGEPLQSKEALKGRSRSLFPQRLLGPVRKFPENPVLDVGPSGSWDEGYVEPDHITFRSFQHQPGGKYAETKKFWLYYHGCAGEWEWKIGLAYADDLINWTKEEDNPILTLGGAEEWDGTGVFNPVVHFVEPDEYHMIYGGTNIDVSPRLNGLGHATSKDGINWVKDDSRNPLLLVDEFIYPASMFYEQEDEEWRLYVHYGSGYAHPKAEGTQEVRLYLSEDMYNWREYEGNPLFSELGYTTLRKTVNYAYVTKLNANLYLACVEWKNKMIEEAGRYFVDFAYSTNGKEWSLLPGQRLCIGPEGVWDDERISIPTLFFWKNKLYIAYAGGRPEKVGMAEVSLTDEGNSGYFRNSDGKWQDLSISAGDTTYGIPTKGYGKKTFYFVADAAGTLTIEVQEPDYTWRTYDTVSVSADTVETYLMNAEARGVRLSYDTGATVSAWYDLQIS